MKLVDISSIPHYLVAGDYKDLQRLMLKNNIDRGTFFKYFDIRELSDGSWIAWYYDEVDIKGLFKKSENNGVEDGN